MDATVWTNGSFTVRWKDGDTVEIVAHSKHRERVCRIHGGDFESFLDNLITAYEMGKREAKEGGS